MGDILDDSFQDIQEALENALSELDEETPKALKGGEGSGNFDHEGRPGEVGGSGEGGGGQAGGKKLPPVNVGEGFDNEHAARQAKWVMENKIPQKHLGYVSSVRVDQEVVDRFNAEYPNSTPAEFGGLAGGYYEDSVQRIVLGKDLGMMVDHEIAHAVYARGTNAMERLETGIAYKASKETGKGFVSEYAKTNIGEYFAESYAAYSRAPRKFAKLNPVMGKILKRLW